MKKVYRLKDIENILTFVPPFFILFLAISVFFVGFIILENREKNEINLITQKSELQKSFKYQNELKKFIRDSDELIHQKLNTIELKLKEEVHTLLGLCKGISYTKELHVKDILTHINSSEIQNNINFAIFDKSNNILYGKKSLQNIQELIFSQKNSDILQKITLMYIGSQGNTSTFRWKNDIDKTIQVSYFEKFEPKKWYIGSFSSIDSLKKITQETILNAIKSTEHKDFYIWFYDSENKKSYNINNKAKWTIASKPSNTLIQYNYDKYFFKVLITPVIKDSPKIDEIKNNYKNKKSILFLIVLTTTFVLVFFTMLFSSFIKKIVSAHNKELESKNRTLNIWKERFELAVIASNDGLWDTNFNTKKTYFSKKWLEMLGYKIGDIKSYEEWFALIHKDDKKVFNETLNEHLNNKKEHLICEYRLKTKNGSYKWVLARGKVFFNKDGTAKRLLMMSMDINAKKRVEKDLKDTELLVSDGDIVFFRVKNSEKLDIISISKSIKIYGYEPKDFLEKNLSYIDIIHPEDKDIFIASLNAHKNQGFKDFSKSYRIITKTGQIKWIFNRVLFIKDDCTNIINLYGYIYDITALKQSEMELEIRVQKEVEKNQEKQKLLIQQNKLAAMGEMIGSIAHQWRQPLNNISLVLHFIKDNYKSLSENEITKYTANAKEQLEYMSHTIDDFRNFYKPSKQKEDFVVYDALQSSLSIIKSQLEKNDISLHVNKHNLKINGYENEFKQAILNILSNAIDAIKHSKPTNPIIDISIDNSSVSIYNNGGIATQEVLDRMFEPYYTTKFETKGTGIGLYMTKTILENMKADICVQNQDEGVKFTITFEK